MSHRVPGRSYLCIEVYHNKLPVIKQVEDFSTDSVIKMCKVFLSEYILPSHTVSGTNLFQRHLRDSTKYLAYNMWCHHHVSFADNITANKPWITKQSKLLFNRMTTGLKPIISRPPIMHKMMRVIKLH